MGRRKAEMNQSQETCLVLIFKLAYADRKDVPRLQQGGVF
jgi:hypothetical protein